MCVQVAGGAEGLVTASADVLPVGGLVQPLVDPQVVRPGEALAALLKRTSVRIGWHLQ